MLPLIPWLYLPVVKPTNQGALLNTTQVRVLLYCPAGKVRFLLPLVVTFFFLALVTLIGGGVPVRGISSSTSYAGNVVGNGAGTAPFPTEAGLLTGSNEGVARRRTAPSGISPTLSTTKDTGDAVLGVFRRLGSRESSARQTHKRRETRWNGDNAYLG